MSLPYVDSYSHSCHRALNEVIGIMLENVYGVVATEDQARAVRELLHDG